MAYREQKNVHLVAWEQWTLHLFPLSSVVELCSGSAVALALELRMTGERYFIDSAHLADARPWRSSSIDFRTRQRHRHWYSSFTSARRWRVVVRRSVKKLSNVYATLSALSVKRFSNFEYDTKATRKVIPEWITLYGSSCNFDTSSRKKTVKHVQPSFQTLQSKN